MGFFKEIFSLGKELGEILSDGRKELTEIMTDGFKEMVIKGNNDYKTSFEKKDEAKSIVANARSKYNTAFDEVQAKFVQVQQMVDQHYQFKVEMYNRIKQEHSSTVEKYIKKYEMKKKEFELSYAAQGSPFNAAALAVAAKFATGSLPVLAGMDLLSQRKRVQEADDFLDDAKEIRAKLNLECEKLRKIKSNLILVEEAIKEERKLIGRLLGPLEEKMSQLEKILKSFVKKKTQMKEAEDAISIIKLLEQTLTTQFLQDKAVITKQYKELMSQLGNMEQKIHQGRE